METIGAGDGVCLPTQLMDYGKERDLKGGRGRKRDTGMARGPTRSEGAWGGGEGNEEEGERGS